MNSNFIAQLHRSINEYRAIINQAESIHEEFLGNPTKALICREIRCYKQASELCGSIAGMYDYSQAQCAEWLEKQAACERKLRELLYIHDNGLPNPSEEDEILLPERRSAAKGDKQPVGKSIGSKPTGSKSGSRPGSEVTEEMVQGWHKPRPNVTFEKDVVGMEELVAKLRACVQDVASSSVNDYLGMSKIHSFFLYGPPGGGKTHVTKAFIHELMGLGYEYLFLSGGDVHQSLVGMSEKVVERAFEEAKKCAPCILFIDEVDSVCKDRDLPHLPTHAMNTTVAFLNGYNALHEAEKHVIFIGATNYPHQVDSAMLDRVEMVQVPLPDVTIRTKVFKDALEEKFRNEPGFDYADMADETYNYSQRDMERLILMIKRSVKKDLTAVHGDNGDAMIDDMKTGKYLLTRERFMDTLNQYHPRSKADYVFKLDHWDAKRGSKED